MTSSLRWWIEKSDATGYLLPIGAELESSSSVYQKTANTPYWDGQNPPLLLAFQGVATNQNATPSAEQVATAVDAFNTFAVTNDTIAKVQMIDYEGSASESMGAALAEIPATASVVQTYLPAYESSGFEVTDFNTSNTVYPHNFTFEIRLSNLYITSAGGGSSPADIGDLVSGNVVTSRSVANGIESTMLTLSVRLRDDRQLEPALDEMLRVATGDASSTFAQMFGPGTAPDSSRQTRFGGQFNSAEVDFFQYDYNAATMDFNCQVSTSRPATGTRKGGFSIERGMNVTGEYNLDTGLVRRRVKGIGSGGFRGTVFERAYAPEVTLNVAVNLVAFRSGESSKDPKGHSWELFKKNLETILDTMDFGSFVLMSRSGARGSGGISVTGIETGNTRTARMTYFGSEIPSEPPSDTQTSRDRARAANSNSIEAAAEAVLAKVELAAAISANTSLSGLTQQFEGALTSAQ